MLVSRWVVERLIRARTNRRVLIIEDNPGDISIIRRHCEHLGYKPTVVTSVMDAEREMDRVTYMVILLDLHIPGNNALGFYHRILIDHPDQTIVIITGDLGEVSHMKSGYHYRIILKGTESASLAQAIRMATSQAKNGRLSSADSAVVMCLLTILSMALGYWLCLHKELHP